MVRRRKPKFKKVEAREACFYELLYLEVGKETLMEAPSSRFVTRSLKIKRKKKTGMHLSCREIFRPRADTSIDDDRPKIEN